MLQILKKLIRYSEILRGQNHIIIVRDTSDLFSGHFYNFTFSEPTKITLIVVADCLQSQIWNKVIIILKQAVCKQKVATMIKFSIFVKVFQIELSYIFLIHSLFHTWCFHFGIICILCRYSRWQRTASEQKTVVSHTKEVPEKVNCHADVIFTYLNFCNKISFSNENPRYNMSDINRNGIN